MQRHLLLAEEDPTVLQFLADNLAADGYAMHQARDEEQARAALSALAPDVVVADVNGRTLELLDWLRDEGQASVAGRDVPVLVLSSHGDVVHRVRLLERGADDVLEKPFSYLELRARVAALLRRARPHHPARATSAGPVWIDDITRTVTAATEVIACSGFEYRLLCHLATEPERVFTREELLRDIWGYRCPADARTRTLDTHAHRLRTKLQRVTDRKLVINVWGVGYRLLEPEPQPATVGTV